MERNMYICTQQYKWLAMHDHHSLVSSVHVQEEQSGLKEVCRGKNEVLAAKELEIVATERALSEEKQRVSSLDEECAALKGRLEGKTEEIGSLQAHNRSLKVQLYIGRA